MVEGISELGEGVLLGGHYRLVRRIESLAGGTERVAGVEYEYWVALDVVDGAEVWIQFAAADGVYAGGAALAGAVAALRRINHPAVPAVRAFGEYEFELEGAITSVGYSAVPAYTGETLAAVLLREELDQAEILATLGQVSEVLELLAEFELVHGHLSAHSVLLTAGAQEGYGVVLVDLPASLSLETAVESELTVAADVYALAWLTVLALVGPAALEAEFGAGFAVTAERELLAEQVVRRRRGWAEENLEALGFSAELAAVLVLALGEAGARPRAATLTAALRAEWTLYAAGVGVIMGGEEAQRVETAAASAAPAAAITEMIPRATGASGSARAPGAGGSLGMGGSAGAARSMSTHPRRRPRSALLIGAGVGVVVIVIALIIVMASGGSKGTTAASGGVTTSGASAPATTATPGMAGSPAASASASPTASSVAGAAGGAGSSPSTATSGEVAFPTSLATVPASASQTVRLIRSAVTQAQGELSGTEQAQLNHIIGTLNQEIGSGRSLSTGTAQLWTLLHSRELPSSLNTYLIQLATYLSASQGS